MAVLAVALAGCAAPGGPGDPGPSAAGLFPFFADDGVHGSEPWVTDGTPEGTRLLADLVSGPGSSEDFGSLGRYVRLGGALVFYASNAANDQPALYRSDGTDAGTVAFAPGLAFGPASARFGDELVFNHVEVTGPPQGLYRTDGTAAGTVRLGDSVPGFFTGVRVPRPPLHQADAAAQGAVFANHQGALWRLDASGASQVRAFDDSCASSSGTFTPGIGSLGTTLFFNASAAFVHPTTGASEAARCELWRFDSASGDGPVIHRAFAANATQTSTIRGFAEAGGWLYYTLRVSDAADATVTLQARATDGSPAPGDGSPDQGDVNLALDVGVNGALVFLQRAADEPIYAYARTPDTGGVLALARLVGGPAEASLELIQALPEGNLFDVFGWVGEYLIYRARGADAGLYALRNGSDDPVLLFDAVEVPSERFLRDRVYPRAFFWVQAPLDGALDPTTAPLVETLWVTDGTPAGTRALRSFCTSDGSCPATAD